MILLRFCLFALYYSLIVEHPPSPTIPFPARRNYGCVSPKINISPIDVIKISTLGTLSIMLFVNLFLQLCTSVNFIEFITDLSTKSKSTFHRQYTFQPLILLLLYGILLNEHEGCWFFLFCNLNLNNLHGIKNPSKSTVKNVGHITYLVITFYIFYLANTPFTEHLCLVTFQNCCYFFFKYNPQWLPLILIKLSNDVHPNPGPFQNAYFSFMNCKYNPHWLPIFLIKFQTMCIPILVHFKMLTLVL